MLTASNVSYTYPEASDTVLEGLSFSVPAGSRVLVIGENGAGKSTLLRMISGAHKTSTGSLRVFGEDSFEDSNRKCSVKLITSDLPGYLCYLKKNHTVRDVIPEAPSTRSLEAFTQEFGIDLDAQLDALSEGELRKLHIMLTLLRPVQLLLIDECTRDVDMLSRHAFIRHLRDMAGESAAAALPTTVLYATHILDDVVEWPTHILHVKDKKATLTMANRINPKELFGLTDQLLSSTMGDFDAKLAEFSAVMSAAKDEAAQRCGNYDVTIEGYDVKRLFASKTKRGNQAPSSSVCDVRIAAGERVVLLGENGAGKTHLLQLLAGEHFYPASNALGLRLRIGDRPCFHDTTLVRDVAYGGQWWSDTDPEWDLSVREMLDCRYPQWETCAYAGFVLEMFSVRLDWRARRLSSGQRKRVQLLLRLVPLKRVVFLDEATSDLDMPQRLKFLLFLQHLSVARGVTIVYCSHIYDDLMWWGTHALFLRASPQYLDIFRAKYGEFVGLENIAPGGADRQSFLVAKKEKV